MARTILVPFGLAAALGCLAAPTQVAAFKCPHVGGDFVFGQESNVNSLDRSLQHGLDAQRRHEHVRDAADARREQQPDH